MSRTRRNLHGEVGDELIDFHLVHESETGGLFEQVIESFSVLDSQSKRVSFFRLLRVSRLGERRRTNAQRIWVEFEEVLYRVLHGIDRLNVGVVTGAHVVKPSFDSGSANVQFTLEPSQRVKMRRSILMLFLNDQSPFERDLRLLLRKLFEIVEGQLLVNVASRKGQKEAFTRQSKTDRGFAFLRVRSNRVEKKGFG